MMFWELQASSAFSFLHAASQPEELVQTAQELGLAGLAIADRNTLAGQVRAHVAAEKMGLAFIPAARLVFADATPDITCYPTDRAGWGRLSRLISLGKGRAKKGECTLFLADLLAAHEGLAILVHDGNEEVLPHLRDVFRRRIWLAATRRYGPADREEMAHRAAVARQHFISLLATNDALYHAPTRRRLQDVMTCIRLGSTIDKAGLHLLANAERHLKSGTEMARLFRHYPHAIAASQDLAALCSFSLRQISYEYPDEPIPPDVSPDEHLDALTWSGAEQRYPRGFPEGLRKSLKQELAMIAQLRYAAYFLTVYDIVRYARERGILCQGRGSAANSTVCYCLGITAVDPTQIDLLFERFISAERSEPPDIDVDFEHERREEVIQYIYQRYGHHRAGIAATVIHYRPKMAIRDVGKVMGLAEDAIAALSAQSWRGGNVAWPDEQVREAGLDPSSREVRQSIELARELLGFPRHLSQHVGGFVLSRGRLDEMVPVGPAAMAGRFFIEWDKDDIDALGIMKVDVLALGMLSCIRRAMALLRERGIPLSDLADILREDPLVYRMLSRADSIGVFQVESRAQMSMLPRLKPACFYDLVIEVAIVRPGPIQGDMVHPYLRRREGREDVTYPSPDSAQGDKDELRRVLEKTKGVPLFQEQAMRIAIEAAKFTPEEANQLRRSMATFRHAGTIHMFNAKMVEGMVARGYERDFAERCFRQIEGFGEYGFPESHAASFALLVYVSAWLKCHHPAAFACALLNSQPMGFYAPAQIIIDARNHGVRVQEIDINRSDWDSSLSPDGALIAGFRLIDGFRAEWAEFLAARRPFEGFSALAICGLPRPALLALAEADAMRSIGLDRRTALWRVRGLRQNFELPLLQSIEDRPTSTKLPLMQPNEHVRNDYAATGFSLKAHPLRFVRASLTAEGVSSCATANALADGKQCVVVGIVLTRQRPGSAKGVIFITIEDETGSTNAVVWPQTVETYRSAVLTSAVLKISGVVQRSPEGVTHLVANRLENCSELLRLEPSRSIHPRVEELPKSRDFR